MRAVRAVCAVCAVRAAAIHRAVATLEVTVASISATRPEVGGARVVPPVALDHLRTPTRVFVQDVASVEAALQVAVASVRTVGRPKVEVARVASRPQHRCARFATRKIPVHVPVVLGPAHRLRLWRGLYLQLRLRSHRSISSPVATPIKRCTPIEIPIDSCVQLRLQLRLGLRRAGAGRDRVRRGLQEGKRAHFARAAAHRA